MPARSAQAWGAGAPMSDLVSIGPFMLTRYESGQRLVFDRNPRYWKKDAAGQPLPYLDQIDPRDRARSECRAGAAAVGPDRHAAAAGAARRRRHAAPAGRSEEAPDARARRGHRSRRLLLQPAAGEVGEGSARVLAHAQGVPPGDLARHRSRGVRQQRVPRRGRADLGAGHARQQELVLAQRDALPVLARARQGAAGRARPRQSRRR